MSIPVYLFTGFLDAGKTAFIQETLEDPGFNTGEKTLVLLCEEGENEYRPERFAGGNVSFLPVEEQAGLTTAFLKDYQKKHRVDRVLIEYNGMWPLQALYDALPKDWDIYQIILLADSTTFASYMTNMRQLAVDKLQDPEMVIFNRCTDATDKAYLHRAVRMVNRRAQMAFERTDGSVDPDDVVDELPFDTDAPVIDIADEDFGPVAVISRGQTAQLFTEYRRPGHIFFRSLAVLHGIFPECLMTAFSALGIQQPVYVAGALFL